MVCRMHIRESHLSAPFPPRSMYMLRYCRPNESGGSQAARLLRDAPRRLYLWPHGSIGFRGLDSRGCASGVAAAALVSTRIRGRGEPAALANVILSMSRGGQRGRTESEGRSRWGWGRKGRGREEKGSPSVSAARGIASQNHPLQRPLNKLNKF